jgi:hypothetical protein
MVMRKKGVSQLVGNVLLILVALAAIGALSVIINNVVKDDSLSDSQKGLNCLQGVEIELLSVCYENNLLNIEVKNKRELTLGDFFLIDITFQNGSKLEIPTPYNTFVDGYETKTISMIYYDDTKDIQVIPQIESQAFPCREQAPIYKNVLECEDE